MYINVVQCALCCVSHKGHTNAGGWSEVLKKKKDLNKIEILDVQMPSRKALLAIIKSNLKNV